MLGCCGAQTFGCVDTFTVDVYRPFTVHRDQAGAGHLYFSYRNRDGTFWEYDIDPITLISRLYIDGNLRNTGEYIAWNRWITGRTAAEIASAQFFSPYSDETNYDFLNGLIDNYDLDANRNVWQSLVNNPITSNSHARISLFNPSIIWSSLCSDYAMSSNVACVIAQTYNSKPSQYYRAYVYVTGKTRIFLRNDVPSVCLYRRQCANPDALAVEDAIPCSPVGVGDPYQCVELYRYPLSLEQFECSHQLLPCTDISCTVETGYPDPLGPNRWGEVVRFVDIERLNINEVVHIMPNCECNPAP